MRKRILITGGAGFIGTHLTQNLADGDYAVTVLDLNIPAQKVRGVTYIQGDVRNRADLQPLISACDVVFHLAAIVSVPLCEQDPAGSYEVNTTSTKKILDLIQKENLTREEQKKVRIVFSSSSAVYGDLGNTMLKIPESAILPNPVSHYGAQKLDSEKLIASYVKTYQVPAVVFRFFNVYGPGQKANSPYSGVISQFVKRVLEKQPLYLNGGGDQTRDFISVHDVVHALTRAIHINQPLTLSGTPINLGSGQTITIRDLAKAVYETSSVEPNLIDAPARAGDILHSCAEISTAKRLLNWQPMVELTDGIRDLLASPPAPSPILRKFHFHHLQFFVFLSVTLLWVCAVFVIQPDVAYSNLILGYSFLTTLLLFWFLYGLDYFSSFHPVPKPDSLLTLFAVSPIAGAVSKYLMLVVFQVEMLRYREVLAISPFVAIVIYAIQVTGGLGFIRSGLKRKICFLTSREETLKVSRALRSEGILQHYEFIDGHALDQNPLMDDLACVVISRSEVRRFEKQESIVQAMIAGRQIIDYREMVARLNGHLDLETINLWMFLHESVRKKILGRIYYSGKTALERILSLVFLILLIPMFLIVALVIKVTSAGPVFYGQNRWGLQGQEFRLWKFRSMRQDAEKGGHQWSVQNDPRITRIGAILRKTRIDELPQLWNVLKGEMSLIGPRPERPEFYIDLENEIPLFRFRLLVRPGITGWAQVMGGYASTIAQTRRKLEYDLFYLQRMSPKMDFMIAVKTVSVALKALLPG
jgi:nucleoside-diphosphate-sugar epimerase/lipopolysaccharide/colanic/teichoic acid biosynthesis glycosyltransferase